MKTCFIIYAICLFQVFNCGLKKDEIIKETNNMNDYGEKQENLMIPLNKDDNEELIYEKGSYSKMLNSMNSNSNNARVVERRHRIVFKSPDAANNRKNNNDKDEILNLIDRKIKEGSNKKINKIIQSAEASKSFFSLE